MPSTVQHPCGGVKPEQLVTARLYGVMERYRVQPPRKVLAAVTLEVAPDKSAEVKASITADQMRRIGHFDVEPTFETLTPYRGWRTRMRLAVDDEGHAGLRVKSGHRVVTNAVCSQAAPGLMDGLDAMRFTPGAEAILALDSNGIRHIVEVDGGASSKQRSGKTRSRESRRGRRGAAR